MSQPSDTIASLTKRLLALTYDSFLVFAICMAIAAIYTSSARALIGDQPIPGWFLQLTLLPCLILAVGSFYAYCWRRTGQTLGMQTWRIKVVSADTRHPLSLKQCGWRFAGAWLSFLCLGCGFLILLRKSNTQTWHDRWSNTLVLDVSKRVEK